MGEAAQCTPLHDAAYAPDFKVMHETHLTRNRHSFSVRRTRFPEKPKGIRSRCACPREDEVGGYDETCAALAGLAMDSHNIFWVSLQPAVHVFAAITNQLERSRLGGRRCEDLGTTGQLPPEKRTL